MMGEQAVMLTGHSLADECGTLLAVDANLCEILARDEHEVVGLGFQALTHPDDRARSLASVKGLQKSDSLSIIRKRYVRPDKTVVWATVFMSRLKGREGLIVGTIQVDTNLLPSRSPRALRYLAVIEVERLEKRRSMLGDELFSDYPWFMLLHLYISEAKGQAFTMASLPALIHIRSKTAARWLSALEQRFLVERGASKHDLLQLTACGFAQVEALLSSGLSS